MKNRMMVSLFALGVMMNVAHADQAALDAFIDAKVVLTDAQKSELLAQSCTDAASCNALVEIVAKIAASQAGNDAAVVAIHTAFAKVHPNLSAAAIERTIALAPTTAVALAALQLELQATAAGPLNLAQLNNPLTALQRTQNSTNNLGQSISGVVFSPNPGVIISSSPSTP